MAKAPQENKILSQQLLNTCWLCPSLLKSSSTRGNFEKSHPTTIQEPLDHSYCEEVEFLLLMPVCSRELPAMLVVSDAGTCACAQSCSTKHTKAAF